MGEFTLGGDKAARPPGIRACFRPPSLYFYLAVAALGAPGPFLAAVHGYGAWIRAAWLLVPIFLAPLAAALLVGLFLAALIPLSWRRKEPPEPWATMARRVKWPIAWLVLCLSFFLGWFAGVQAREAHCRRLCRRCEPILGALEAYRREHGAYPEHLRQLPGFPALDAASGLSLREGRFSKHGGFEVDVFASDRPDATFYMTPKEYCVAVEIERPFIMSFTRFYVYQRCSGSGDWKLDHIVWVLEAL